MRFWDVAMVTGRHGSLISLLQCSAAPVAQCWHQQMHSLFTRFHDVLPLKLHAASPPLPVQTNGHFRGSGKRWDTAEGCSVCFWRGSENLWRLRLLRERVLDVRCCLAMETEVSWIQLLRSRDARGPRNHHPARYCLPVCLSIIGYFLNMGHLLKIKGPYGF